MTIIEQKEHAQKPPSVSIVSDNINTTSPSLYDMHYGTFFIRFFSHACNYTSYTSLTSIAGINKEK